MQFMYICESLLQIRKRNNFSENALIQKEAFDVNIESAPLFTTATNENCVEQNDTILFYQVYKTPMPH